MPGQGGRASRARPHLLSSLSSFCHLSAPFCRTLSYQITSPPGTALCTCAVKCRRKRGRFSTAAAWRERAGRGWHGAGEGPRAGAARGQGRGQRGGQGATAAHAQCVLYVDQPAIEAVVLGDAGQLLAHGAVRLRLAGQERLAQLLAVRPLRDERAWGNSESSVGHTPRQTHCIPGAPPGLVLQAPAPQPALPSPSTGTPFLCAALVQHTGGMVTVWWLK